MVEEHLFRQRRALPQGKQLEHLIFLTGEMHALTMHFNGLGIEIHPEVARLNDGLRMALRPTHDSMNAGYELVPMERLGHIVVRAKTKATNLVIYSGQTGKNEDGR